MAIQLAKKLFTVDEFQLMAQAGVFMDDERLELIEGEILEMSPIGHRHAACVDRLTSLCVAQLSSKAIVRVQGPLQVNKRTQSQPDIALLKARADYYEDGLPTTADALLLIEVSDSTLEYDRGAKLTLYAQSHASEVWIINLPDEIIEVYTQPGEMGYKASARYFRGDKVTARSLPILILEVNAILGAPKSDTQS